MADTIPNIYVDTSVFGGVFDAEFANASRAFFREVRGGRFLVTTSELVENELRDAPGRVREFFDGMLVHIRHADVSTDALRLRRAYVEQGVVTASSAADALHVAIASTSHCEVLVSWNCRHIVHFLKIPLYNAVNELHGLRRIAIHTPAEVIGDEDEEKGL